MKIFVIGSYNGATRKEIEKNIEGANNAGIEILRKGHIPFVAQSMFAFWEKKVDMKKIMKACFKWIKECDAVLVLSIGSKGGGTWSAREVARKHNKKIFKSIDEIPTK